MAYRLQYSDYPGTAEGPPDPARWVGPPGPAGPPGPVGPQGPSPGNVRAFGAKGDGVTDDTTAIQGVANGGGILYFPPGIYQVSAPISVPSNTSVRGDGATLRAATGFPINSPLLVNQNAAATVLTDHDISVFGMTLDYATFGTGGSHAIEMDFVTNVRIVDCTFQCRGAGNATACPGSYNTSVEGCTAYGFVNCGYDWWWGPKNARLTNCYAETATSAQMINFNPEQTTGSSTGLAASGFAVTNCQFKATGSSLAVPMQVEPLGAGTTVSDVTIQNNVFVNVSLSMRRAVSNAIVAGNVFDGCPGGVEVIRSYAADGGTPSGITVVNNVVNNATTVGANVAVIRIETAPAIVMDNSVINATGGAYAYSTGTSAAIFLGNLGSPHTTANAVGGPGPPVWTA